MNKDHDGRNQSMRIKVIAHDEDQNYHIVEVVAGSQEIAWIVAETPRNMKEAKCNSVDDIVDLDDYEHVVDRRPGR